MNTSRDKNRRCRLCVNILIANLSPRWLRSFFIQDCRKNVHSQSAKSYVHCPDVRSSFSNRSYYVVFKSYVWASAFLMRSTACMIPCWNVLSSRTDFGFSVSASPTFIVCPIFNANEKSLGASNSSTIVEPILNSPNNSPFFTLVQSRLASSDVFPCGHFFWLVDKSLSQYTFIDPTLVAPTAAYAM